MTTRACYYKDMLRVGVFGVFLLFPLLADAHWPIVRGEVSQHAVEEVVDPVWSRAYYGTLAGHPHTYEFTLTATTTVFIQTLLPELPAAHSLTKPSGLLVEVLPSGRVEEVVRLQPEQAEWMSEYEPFGGDRYLQGPVFDEVLTPGTYLFEISTPDNMTKYALVIGDEERWRGTNPLVLLGRIYQVKQFFEKPWYAIWQSPLYYVPTILLLLGFGIYYGRRRNVVRETV